MDKQPGKGPFRLNHCSLKNYFLIKKGSPMLPYLRLYVPHESHHFFGVFRIFQHFQILQNFLAFLDFVEFPRIFQKFSRIFQDLRPYVTQATCHMNHTMFCWRKNRQMELEEIEHRTNRTQNKCSTIFTWGLHDSDSVTRCFEHYFLVLFLIKFFKYCGLRIC